MPLPTPAVSPTVPFESDECEQHRTVIRKAEEGYRSYKENFGEQLQRRQSAFGSALANQIEKSVAALTSYQICDPSGCVAGNLNPNSPPVSLGEASRAGEIDVPSMVLNQDIGTVEASAENLGACRSKQMRISRAKGTKTDIENASRKFMDDQRLIEAVLGMAVQQDIRAIDRSYKESQKLAEEMLSARSSHSRERKKHHDRTDHPKNDHPGRGDHPKNDHPKNDHPGRGDHPRSNTSLL